MHKAMLPCCLTAAMLCAVAATAEGNNAMAIMDFASGQNRDAWLRHPVYGDPSFDTFERLPCNPVVVGEEPYEWPVNGSLFRDPVSGNWYLYAGLYAYGYAVREESRSQCRVYRSTDAGGTWEEVGGIFDDPNFVFDGEVNGLGSYPDTQVTYVDGKYHMCFDFSTKGFTWEHAHAPSPDTNSGAAHAWAEKPEGPFHISPKPIITTRDMKPLLGKYRRMYGSSLIPRANDWLCLTLTDSGPHFGWAQVATTAPAPEGPYGNPRLILNCEQDCFHPPLMEFFPAFAHGGYVYAPSTSVAANRNFQVVFRAPIEEATKPEAWEIYQHGSVWHAEPVPNEHFGIWGQTISGFIDDGVFNAMFPSRDEKGWGTLNVARRPWAEPYRKQGFTVSGHAGPTVVRTKKRVVPSHIQLSGELRGAVTLAWQVRGPLGPNAARADAQPHPSMATDYVGLEHADGTWTLLTVDPAGKRTELATGTTAASVRAEADIQWTEGDAARVLLGGEPIYEGALPRGDGACALILGPNGHARVESLQVMGEFQPGIARYMYLEALLGAAQNMAHWDVVKDETFTFGEGAVSKAGATEAKWNFEGERCVLHAPKGPNYGKAEAILDGVSLGVLDFNAPTPQPTAPRLTWSGLEGNYHAFKLRPLEGSAVPVDVLEVTMD